MKLAKSEVPKRVSVKVNRNIRKHEGVNGIMLFGEKNDYPQVIENIILSSVTAKATAGIYAKFLAGKGFTSEMNAAVVGIDQFGADITLFDLLCDACYDLAKFNGAYIHGNLNLDFEIVNAKSMPFKYGRIAAVDESGYAAKIGIYNNWDKDKDLKYDESKIRFYNVFSSKREVFNAQIAALDGNIEKYAGQVYPLFLDKTYIYPLSPLDSAYLDADSESQLALTRNRELRNGMSKKTIFRIKPGQLEEKDENGDYKIGVDPELTSEIQSMMGPDGSRVIVIQDEPAIEGDLGKNRNMITETLESNIDSDLFQGWETTLGNNIRKAANALPRVLIEFEQGTVGPTSGESIKQAVSFYNSITDQQRQKISSAFKAIFSRSVNPALKNATDWKINELTLGENGTTTIQPATGN